MGNVHIVYKVYPEDMDKFEELKEAVRKAVSPQAINEEPLAFGMKVLMVSIVRDAKAGEGDAEQKLAALPGVSQVEVDKVDLV